MLKVSLKINTY